jgi:hypothetical protein
MAYNLYTFINIAQVLCAAFVQHILLIRRMSTGLQATKNICFIE